MKNLFALLIFILPLTLTGQESTLQTEFEGLMQYRTSQILQLAEAFPEELYEWTPDEEVRSTASAFLHIAAADYALGQRLGGELPEGLDPWTLEESVSGKENVIATLEEALAFATEAGKNVGNHQMQDMVELPFGTFNKRSVMMIVLSHNTEHLGQLVAYARMNGITPPWSKEE